MSTGTLTSFSLLDNGTLSTTTRATVRHSQDTAIAQPAAGGAAESTMTLDLDFRPWFPAFATWLPAVELRISNATLPDGHAGLEKSEWVSEEVGAAAIRFFQNAADVLPSEPFIYGSKSGALVAEFQATNGALTTVISPNITTLFAVRKDRPEDPVHITIKRGSNRLREDLKDIAQTLMASHGPLGSPKQR